METECFTRQLRLLQQVQAQPRTPTHVQPHTQTYSIPHAYNSPHVASLTVPSSSLLTPFSAPHNTPVSSLDTWFHQQPLVRTQPQPQRLTPSPSPFTSHSPSYGQSGSACEFSLGTHASRDVYAKTADVQRETQRQTEHTEESSVDHIEAECMLLEREIREEEQMREMLAEEGVTLEERAKELTRQENE